jgi:hypothetical protein
MFGGAADHGASGIVPGVFPDHLPVWFKLFPLKFYPPLNISP